MQFQNQTLRYQLQGFQNNQYLVLSIQTGWLCHFPSYLLTKKKTKELLLWHSLRKQATISNLCRAVTYFLVKYA